MAGNILTPNAIWGGFKVNTPIGIEVVGERSKGNIIYSDVFIEGRKTADGCVEIFGVYAKSAQLSVSTPAILVLNDLVSGVDYTLIEDLVKRGYAVLAIDLAGKVDGKENFTIYPESVSYANYETVKDKLTAVDGDANQTCWYEWCCAARYALAFLKSQNGVSKVGAIASGDAATVLWQVAGTDELLDAAAFTLNAGWAGYRGIYKYAGTVEPQFDDNMYKFIAGIEPQAYAMHVKCPVLMLAATNSKLYDCDRVYDTVSRINENLFRAVHYSVGYEKGVGYNAYQNLLLFFNELLNKEGGVADLPLEPEIKCEILNGEFLVEVTPSVKDLESVAVYVSEEQIAPSVRCWQKISAFTLSSDGKYTFKYLPYSNSGIVTAFATVKHNSGFELCTNIVAKRFKENEINQAFKQNIIYSSREENSESVFTSVEKEYDFITVSDKSPVKVKKGPMGILGVTAKNGLLTFKMGAKRYKPTDGAMLMLDVYAKEKCVLTVKLFADYAGNKTEYIANVNVLGGDVWHNVQLEMNKFKTCEGMALKSYQKLDAIGFSVDGVDYLINNALWV